MKGLLTIVVQGSCLSGPEGLSAEKAFLRNALRQAKSRTRELTNAFPRLTIHAARDDRNAGFAPGTGWAAISYRVTWPEPREAEVAAFEALLFQKPGAGVIWSDTDDMVRRAPAESAVLVDQTHDSFQDGWQGRTHEDRESRFTGAGPWSSEGSPKDPPAAAGIDPDTAMVTPPPVDAVGQAHESFQGRWQDLSNGDKESRFTDDGARSAEIPPKDPPAVAGIDPGVALVTPPRVEAVDQRHDSFHGPWQARPHEDTESHFTAHGSRFSESWPEDPPAAAGVDPDAAAATCHSELSDVGVPATARQMEDGAVLMHGTHLQRDDPARFALTPTDAPQESIMTIHSVQEVTLLQLDDPQKLHLLLADGQGIDLASIRPGDDLGDLITTAECSSALVTLLQKYRIVDS